MKNRNLMILLVMGAAAVLLLVLALALKPAPQRDIDGDYVLVTVDNREYARIPLSDPQQVRVEQADGQVNIIDVTEKGAVMTSSTCHNQQCVRMGEVTLDNWELRPNQTFIICLPNKVTVELVVKE